MREHPVPQDITGYQFHIIGDMTIKQFAEVFAGCIVGLIIYATNLPGIIKWPFIAIAIGLGALAAFVPIEEQPIDHWIVVFIRTLYKPTKFYWRREAHIPDAFRFQPSDSTQTDTQSKVDLSPAKRERIKQFMSSIETEDSRTAYEDWEDEYLSYITQSFDSVQTTHQNVQQGFQKPAFSTSPRQLGIDPSALNADNSSHTSDANRTNTPQNTQGVAQEIEIPENTAASADTALQQEEPEAQPSAQSRLQQSGIDTSQPSPVSQPRSASQNTLTNSALPFPQPPSQPNTLVGMVLATDNDVIPGAIVEFHNAETGSVSRAVKTNKLGQFFTSNALPNGTYIIHTEKPGFQFQDSRLILQGELVPPLEIRGSREGDTQSPPLQA